MSGWEYRIIQNRQYTKSRRIKRMYDKNGKETGKPVRSQIKFGMYLDKKLEKYYLEKRDEDDGEYGYYYTFSAWLNKLGSEGWEICGTYGDPHAGNGTYFVLKRQIFN